MSVLGIVENMSGLSCPHCGGRIDLFRSGGGERAARDLDVPFLGAIPIDPSVVINGDEGTPAELQDHDSEIAVAFRSLAGKIEQTLESSVVRTARSASQR
jgi:ATP-binding protein involved in chromosome partitioning